MPFPYPPAYKDLAKRHVFFTIPRDQLHTNFVCAHCKDILMDPYKSDCNCRFCKHCVRSFQTICPGCSVPINNNNTSRMSVDEVTEMEIAELTIKCLNKWCRHVGKLLNLSEHLKNCRYRLTVTCADCGMEILKEHFKTIHRNVYGNKDSLCDNWTGVCPFRCSNAEIVNIKTHLSDCDNIFIKCPLGSLGCTKILPRIKMDNHFVDDVIYHLRLGFFELVRLGPVDKCKRLKQMRGSLELCLFIVNETKAAKVTQINHFTEVFLACERSEESVKDTLKSFGYYVYSFDKVSSRIEEARIKNRSCVCSLSDESIIPQFTLNLELCVRERTDSVYISMRICRFNIGNNEQGPYKVVGIKVNLLDTIEDNDWINLRKLRPGRMSKVKEITLGEIQELHGREELWLIVEIMDVPEPETVQ